MQCNATQRSEVIRRKEGKKEGRQKQRNYGNCARQPMQLAGWLAGWLEGGARAVEWSGVERSGEEWSGVEGSEYKSQSMCTVSEKEMLTVTQ